ncbi:MAG: hypothetical protein F9K28_07430 [Bacteroidetes bacterium]|nr:MAG: hypothetical protein F9K28_07430 [Bacteroidota bacterium]
MDNKDTRIIIVAIFPYVHLAEPITIRDINLFPSQMIEENLHICDECKFHAKKLFQLFYWHDNTPIQQMIYTTLHVDEGDIQRKREFFGNLESVRILLGYICCAPDEHSLTIYNNYEQAHLYIFYPSKWVSKSLVYCADIDVEAEGNNYPQHYTDGYEFYLNFGDIMWATEACRIYPAFTPQGKSQLRLSEILKTLVFQHDVGKPSVNWEFLLDKRFIDADLELRLLRSMEWYNRSCKSDSTTDVGLIYLAIAFETLLGVDGGTTGDISDVRRRLWDSIRVLVGSIPRLQSWFEQFYHARSRIVHEGYWSHIKFYLLDDEKIGNARRNLQLDDVGSYGYLIQYGHVVFRICFNAVVAGLIKTSELNLRSRFFINQERLEKIREILKNVANAEEALVAIVADIQSLYRYRFEPSNFVKVETVVQVGESLAKRFLEITSRISISEETKQKVQNLLEDLLPESQEHTHAVAKSKIVAIFEATKELPPAVTQPAMADLGNGSLHITQVKQKLQQILEDSRNSGISISLRKQLENAILLVDDIIMADKLALIASFSTGVSGDIVNERNLYSLLDAYAQYAASIALKHHIRWNLNTE